MTIGTFTDGVERWFIADDAIEVEDSGPSMAKDKPLEVPSWRERRYSSLYSLEGTENLDDAVFLKRHQRQETEERRRKRWDAQRIREQKRIERLLTRRKDRERAAAEAEQAEAINTFWPDPQRDAQFIEIIDNPPIAAFGDIIPELPESEFSLPWLCRAGRAALRVPRNVPRVSRIRHIASPTSTTASTRRKRPARRR